MFAAIPYPQFDPVIFQLPGFELFGLQLGPFPLRWYALAYIAGLALGWRYIVALLRRPRLWGGGAPMQPQSADDLLFWATIGVVAGGRLGYVLFYMLPSAGERARLFANPFTVFEIWNGGMAFHGGLIGVALAIWHFSRSCNVSLLRVGDVAAAATPIGLFFGRLANFINGELWGRPASVPWAMVFPGAGPEPRHPSQLYEAGLEGLALFTILSVLVWRLRALARPGLCAGAFLLCYGLFRAGLEGVRQPDAQLPEFPLGLTMGMMLSLPMIGLGAWLCLRAMRGQPIAPPGADASPAEAPPHAAHSNETAQSHA